MFRTILLLSAVHSIAAVAQPKYFEIEGHLQGDYTGNIYLQYTPLDDHATIRDTAQVDDHTFRFTGHINEPIQATLELEAPSAGAWIYLDAGRITIDSKAGTFTDKGRRINNLNLLSVSGSKSDSVQKSFFSFWKALSLSDEPDSIKSSILFKEMLAVVKANPSSNLSSDMLRDADMLTLPQATTVFNHLSKEQQALAGMNGVDKLLKRLQRTDFGIPYHFIELPDTSGVILSEKKLPHRYMLVEFWASWCGPCREENPRLIQLYQEFHKKGFEILGISLDDEKKAWTRAIRKDQLPWPQVSDLAGTSNRAAMYYMISYVPFNLLVDEKGVIVAKNLKADGLEKRLHSLLKNSQ